jgi:DNA repair photolyase
MPFKWSANPFIGCAHRCQFCFSRRYYVDADRGTASDFSSRIFVKANFAEVLARELAGPSWRGEPIVLGTATDVYQPVEGRYRLTRRVLELLFEHRNPLSLLTKSPLVLRDLDTLAALARQTQVMVFFSITTVDLALWRLLEPGTANPFKRLHVLRLLREAGVPAGVLMAPILPGITDSQEAIEAVAAVAREHRALFFGAGPLRLMPHVKEHYLGFVGESFPTLLPRYERAYPGINAPKEYRARLDERVERVRARYVFGDDPLRPRPAESPPHRRGQLPLPL